MANAAAGVVTASAGAAGCQASPSLRRPRTALSPASSHLPSLPMDLLNRQTFISLEVLQADCEGAGLSGQAEFRHLFSLLGALAPSIWKSSVRPGSRDLWKSPRSLSPSASAWPFACYPDSRIHQQPLVLHTARSCLCSHEFSLPHGPSRAARGGASAPTSPTSTRTRSACGQQVSDQASLCPLPAGRSPSTVTPPAAHPVPLLTEILPDPPGEPKPSHSTSFLRPW